MRVTIALALVLAVAAAATPAAASRQARVRELAGSGDYSDSLARSDGKPGAQVYSSQHFEWAIAPGSRRRALGLKRHGVTSVSVPLQMHVVSSGGGVYMDFVGSTPKEVSYTCSAESTYRTRVSLQATPAPGGRWSVRMGPLEPLQTGTPECTDSYAQDYFSWGTGGDWFVDQSTAVAPLPRGKRRKVKLVFANDPVAQDCTEVPGITPACTQDLAWTATARLIR